MHEHQPSAGYGVGALAVGRLIPHGDGTWLRSQGMVMVPYREGRSEELQRMLEQVWATPPERPQRAVVMEATIHGLLLGQRLPREVAPAPGPEQARKLLAALYPLLDAAGRLEPRATDALGQGELGVVLDSGSFVVHADDVVRDWIRALTRMADK